MRPPLQPPFPPGPGPFYQGPPPLFPGDPPFPMRPELRHYDERPMNFPPPGGPHPGPPHGWEPNNRWRPQRDGPPFDRVDSPMGRLPRLQAVQNPVRNSPSSAGSPRVGDVRPERQERDNPWEPKFKRIGLDKDIYEKGDQVGEGTYARVYKARDTVTGSHVAIKQLRMEGEKDAFPFTAIREAKFLTSLRHENVLQIKETISVRAYGGLCCFRP